MTSCWIHRLLRSDPFHTQRMELPVSTQNTSIPHTRASRSDIRSSGAGISAGHLQAISCSPAGSSVSQISYHALPYIRMQGIRTSCQSAVMFSSCMTMSFLPVTISWYIWFAFAILLWELAQNRKLPFRIQQIRRTYTASHHRRIHMP